MTDHTPTPPTRRDALTQEGRRSRRRGGARRAAFAVVPLALLGSGALVYQASNAAFTASTSTGSNSWTAGSVVLTNGSSGSQLFNVSALKPGVASAATTKCVNVTYTGSLAANVKLYIGTAPTSTPGTGGGNLGSLLRVSVEEGTGSTDAACTGFTSAGSPKYLNAGADKGQTLNTFQSGDSSFTGNYPSTATPWAAPVGSGTPQVASYRVIYWLPDTDDADNPTAQTPLNAVMGSQITATLTWEARNT